MIASGPARRRRTPELQPVLTLLQGLAEREFEQLVVEQPGLRLEVRR
jgi:hypothetical protein